MVYVGSCPPVNNFERGHIKGPIYIYINDIIIQLLMSGAVPKVYSLAAQSSERWCSFNGILLSDNVIYSLNS